ncbi:MAG: MBOAT family O-acyltransferase [Anaerovibrio sp.]
MLFSSMIFLSVFLPVVMGGYYFFAKDKRLYWLLLASLFFYSWGEPKNVAIMLLICLVNYVGAIFISKVNSRRKRLAVLICDVSLTLFVLVYFKYFNFLLSNINIIFQQSFAARNIVMPLGISFFIFQALSYVIDVYRKEVEPQTSFYKLTLYISFFPQLIAGPIVQYHDIVHDIENNNSDFSDVVYGARRFIVGLGKKVLIANQLGAVADNIFNSGFAYVDMPVAWIGALCYSLQLFYDFSGYSDMAIGLGRIFGFHFLENFNYPYISKSITEFWRRWHISLGSWFRKYVYISLGGNRLGNVRTYVNLAVVFFITGLWHGANWTFVLWGMWHGLFIVLERFAGIKTLSDGKYVVLRHIYTIFVFVIGWTMFRADSVSEGIGFIGTMLGIVQPEAVAFTADYYLQANHLTVFIVAIIGSVPIFGRFLEFLQGGQWYKNAIYDIFIIGVLVLSMASLSASTYNPFIYFRF